MDKRFIESSFYMSEKFESFITTMVQWRSPQEDNFLSGFESMIIDYVLGFDGINEVHPYRSKILSLLIGAVGFFAESTIACYESTEWIAER